MQSPTAERLVHVLEELRELIEHDTPANLLLRIDEELQKLKDHSLFVVVLGQFKRGKTTLINALLGENLLPTAIVPVTSAVTMIRWGRERAASVTYAGGRSEALPLEALPEVLSEKGNPLNVKNVRFVEVRHPSSLLAHGMVLIDTPGIGSIGKRNTQTTQDFLPRIDAGIVVFSPDPPITETEMEFLKELAALVPRLILVMNKVDAHEAGECEEARAYISSAVAREIPGLTSPLLSVSARLAVTAAAHPGGGSMPDSGIPALRNALADLQRREGAHVLLAQSGKRLRAFLREASFAAELELKATLLPLDALEENIRRFNAYAVTVKNQDEEEQILIRGRIAALDQRIGRDLEIFAGIAADRIKRTLREWADAHRGRSPREFRDGLREALTATLAAEFDGWRALHEKNIIDSFKGIAETYIRRANATIGEIRMFSSELFSLDVGDLGEPDLCYWDGSFRYKTADDPQFLQADLIRLGSMLVPHPILRGRILSRLLRSAEDKAHRNAGRLRADYVLAIDESARRLLEELRDRREALVLQIQSILGRVSSEAGQTRAATQPRELRVRKRIEALAKLEDQLEGSTHDAVSRPSEQQRPLA